MDPKNIPAVSQQRADGVLQRLVLLLELGGLFGAQPGGAVQLEWYIE